MLARPTFRQVLKCARNMRDLDRREMAALYSADPYELTDECLSFGTPYWGAMHGAVPAYVFGLYVQPHNGVWAAWGFGTSHFPKVVGEVNRFLKRVVFPNMRKAGVDRCECLSLAAKTDAHRWLTWLGTREEDEITDYRCTGETFKLFVWR